MPAHILWVLFLCTASSVAVTFTSLPGSLCGDGITTEGEECDPGFNSSVDGCTDCKLSERGTNCGCSAPISVYSPAVFDAVTTLVAVDGNTSSLSITVTLPYVPDGAINTCYGDSKAFEYAAFRDIYPFNASDSDMTTFGPLPCTNPNWLWAPQPIDFYNTPVITLPGCAVKTVNRISLSNDPPPGVTVTRIDQGVIRVDITLSINAIHPLYPGSTMLSTRQMQVYLTALINGKVTIMLNGAVSIVKAVPEYTTIILNGSLIADIAVRIDPRWTIQTLQVVSANGIRLISTLRSVDGVAMIHITSPTIFSADYQDSPSITLQLVNGAKAATVVLTVPINASASRSSVTTWNVSIVDAQLLVAGKLQQIGGGGDDFMLVLTPNCPIDSNTASVLSASFEGDTQSIQLDPTKISFMVKTPITLQVSFVPDDCAQISPGTYTLRMSFILSPVISTAGSHKLRVLEGGSVELAIPLEIVSTPPKGPTKQIPWVYVPAAVVIGVVLVLVALLIKRRANNRPIN